MAIPRTKLTEAFIRGLTYKDTSFLVRDTMIKGLMVAVNKHTISMQSAPCSMLFGENTPQTSFHLPSAGGLDYSL